MGARFSVLGLQWGHALPYLLLAITILAILTACQTPGREAMPLEEAKRVTASFTSSTFVPPPRTIKDITAILDQQKLADPEAAKQARAQADQPPPNSTNPDTLANFYYKRGVAAGEIGRSKQEIEDLTRAATFASRGMAADQIEILDKLATAELNGGNFARGLELYRRAIGKVRSSQRGWLIWINTALARQYALSGDLEDADAALWEAQMVFNESNRWPNQRPEWIASRTVTRGTL
jgi:tetratricopeptide (TPR) repeat protein